MIVSGYMNFFTVAYVFRFSILDSSTHKSKLILCAVDVVIIFLNGLFASHLQKDLFLALGPGQNCLSFPGQVL